MPISERPREKTLALTQSTMSIYKRLSSELDINQPF